MSSHSPAPSKARQAYIAPALLAAAVVVFLWDCLFAGRAFVMRDAVFDSLPWRRFAAGAARDGHIPLWNPYSRFGQPFVAEPQSGFFYPPHHLFDFLPTAAAFNLTMALHLFVAAAGMYGLLRRFKAATEAALLAAIVFAFGTYFTANLEFMSVMETLAWAPFTILLACRVGDAWGDLRRVATRAIVLTVVLALQILVGQVQVVAFTCVAALTYGTAIALAERRRPAALATVAGFVVAALLAVGLALVQVLPTLDLIPHSVRAAGVDAGLDMGSMSPRHLVTSVFPFAFGGPGAGRWWGVTLHEFWLGCFHVGLTPLVAGLFVVLRPRRVADTGVATAGAAARGAALASAALLVAGLLVAMGKYTPLYGWLQALPGADLVRWPAKGLQLVAIALAVLAGLGFDALLVRREAAAGRIDRVTLVFLSVAGALALALLVAAGKHGADAVWALAGGGAPPEIDTRFVAQDARRSTAFLVLGLAALTLAALRAVPRRVGTGLVLAVCFANLYVLSREIQFVGDDALLDLSPPALAERVHSDYYLAGFGLYGSRDETAYRTAAAVIAGNTGLPYGISSTCPGDALLLTRPDQVVGVLNQLPGGSARGRLADVLAIGREIRGPPFEHLLAQVSADPRARVPELVRRPSPLPAAYLVENWERIDEPSAALGRLLEPSFDIGWQAIEDPTTGLPPLPAPATRRLASPAGSVDDVRHDWNRVDIDVQVERPGLLVLCETWLPGWTVHVDGEERTLARVNVLFRGVALRPGDRQVSMVYAPKSFRTGAAVSFAMLVLLAAGWVWCRRGARRGE